MFGDILLIRRSVSGHAAMSDALSIMAGMVSLTEVPVCRGEENSADGPEPSHPERHDEGEGAHCPHRAVPAGPRRQHRQHGPALLPRARTSSFQGAGQAPHRHCPARSLACIFLCIVARFHFCLMTPPTLKASQWNPSIQTGYVFGKSKNFTVMCESTQQ